MANSKQAGFMEQHFEKILLVICALGLLYGVVHWGLSSPREVEVIGKDGRSVTVPPGQVDAALDAASETLAKEVEDAEPETRNVPPLGPMVTDLRQAQPLVGRGDLPAIAQHTKRLQRIEGPTEAGKGSVDMVTSVLTGPSKPRVLARRVLPQKVGTADELLASGWAVFDWAQMRQQLSTALKRVPLTDLQTVVVGVVVEVQSRTPDGSWSEAQTVEVARVPVTNRDGQIINPPALPDYTGATPDETRAKAVSIAREWESYRLLPSYYRLYFPPQTWIHWSAGMPENEVIAWAREQGVKVREGERIDLPEIDRTRDGDRDRRPRMDEEEEIYRRRNEERMMDEEIYEERPRPRPTVRPRPERIDRPGPPTAGPADETEAPQPPQAKPIPALDDQKRFGKVVVAFHDNTLQQGRQYRYRVRLVLLNPLFAAEPLAADPKKLQVVKSNEDLKTKTVTTPWSPWSDPVAVQQHNEFYVIGSSPAQNTVRVRVFTQSFGQTVEETFSIQPGLPIGGKINTKVLDPVTGEVKQVAVDLSTGAVAVAIDFDRRYEQSVGSTVELTYLDSERRLRSRLKDRDEESDRYRKLLKEAREARAIIERATASVGAR